MWLCLVLSLSRSLKTAPMPNAKVMQARSRASSTIVAYIFSTSEPARGLNTGVIPGWMSAKRVGTLPNDSTASRSSLLSAMLVVRSEPPGGPGSLDKSFQ